MQLETKSTAIYNFMWTYLAAVALFITRIADIACQPDESNIIYINRSIHKNETLFFDVDALFPTLIKDVKVVRENWKQSQDLSPEEQRLQEHYFHLNASQVSITKILEFKSKVQIAEPDHCDFIEEFNYNYFFAFCRDQSLVKVYKIDPEEPKIEMVKTIHLPQEHGISSVYASLTDSCLYILSSARGPVRAGELRKHSVIKEPAVIAEENSNVQCTPDIIDFEMEDFADASMTLRVKHRAEAGSEKSGEELTKIFVFPTYNLQFDADSEEFVQPIRSVDFQVIFQNKVGELDLGQRFSTEQRSEGSTQRIESSSDLFKGSSYLTFLSHKYGYWVLMNKKIENGLHFVLAVCNFEAKEDAIDPGRSLKFVCKHEVDIAPFCKLLDIKQLILNLFYRVEITEESNRSLFYLFTNCNVTLSIFDSAATHKKLPSSGSSRIPFPVQKVLDLDKNDNNAFAVVKPFGDDKAYVLSYKEKYHVTRIFQNQSFTEDNYMFFFDELLARPDLFISHSYNQSERVSTFSIFRFNDEMVITNFSNLVFDKCFTKFALRVQGECANYVTQTYEFNIEVLNCFNKVMHRQPFPEIWFHNNSESPIYNTTLPYSALSTYANDMIIFNKKNPNVAKIKITNMFAPSKELENRSFFYEGIGDDIIVTDELWGLENIKYKLQTEMYFFFQFKNDSISVFHCADPNPDESTSTASEEFFCVSVFFGIQLRLPDTRPIAFRTIRNRRGVYLTTLISKNASQELTLIFVQTIQKKHLVYQVTTHSVRDISYGNLIYNKSNFTFVGVGKKPNISNTTWSIITFEFPVDPWGKTITFHFNDVKGNIFRFPQYNVTSFTAISQTQFAFSQDISQQASLVTYFELQDIANGRVMKNFVVNKTRFTVLKVIKNRIIVVDHVEAMYGFIQLNEKFGERYHGFLPLPNRDDLKVPGWPRSLLEISSYQGITVFLLYSSSEKITFCILDLRFSREDPLVRLIDKREVQMSSSSFLNINFIDRQTFFMHSIFINGTKTSKLRIDLYGKRYSISLLKANLTAFRNQIMLEAQVKQDTTMSPLQLELFAVPTAFAFKVNAIAKQNKVSVFKQLSSEYAIDELIAVSSPTTRFQLIEPDGKMPVATIVQMFDFLPGSIGEAILSRKPGERIDFLEWPKDEVLGQDEDMLVGFSRYMVIWGPRGFRVYLIDRNGPNVSLFLNVKNDNDQRLLYNPFINYDYRMQYTTKGSGPIVIILALYQGQYEMSDLDIYVLDSTKNVTKPPYRIRDACRCDRFRFEIMNRNEENFTLSFHYRHRGDNGTSSITSRIDLIPMPGAANPSILSDFYAKGPYNLYVTTFQLKLSELNSYGLMKPTSNSTMSYYFFENSGMVGLLYIGSTTIYSRHTYSKNCILRKDTFVSCKVIEQDMDIGCIVLCDETRIASFKLRLKVDDIETGSKDTLSGVNLIESESLKIPPNYEVVQLVKGETVDFVVANFSGRHYILMYDTSTSQIVYSMDGETICPERKSECLQRAFIYEMTKNRVLIIPRDTSMANVVYVKKRPKLIINKEAMNRLSSLDGYKLRVHGIKVRDEATGEIVENYKDINFESMFEFKEESMLMLYILLGLILGMGLLCTIFLLAYKHCNSDEAYSSRKDNKRELLRDQKERSLEYHSIMNITNQDSQIGNLSKNSRRKNHFLNTQSST